MFPRVDVPKWIFFLSALILITFVLLIFLFLFITAYPVLSREGVGFLLGSTWDYETGTYGIAPFLAGTFWVTVSTLIIVLPIGILTAIYVAEIAPRSIAALINPVIELLVGIPSIVFGLFGFYILQQYFRDSINPFIHGIFGWIPIFANRDPATGSGILIASLVLAIMVLPTIVALSREAMTSVPQAFREASYSLGATRHETILRVVLPAASQGIMTSVVLGAMRAMGETMAVVMLIGNVPQTPSSILDKGATMTTKIMNDIGFYIAFDDPKAALFSIAVVLFLFEMVFVASLRLISSRWKVKY